MSQAVYNMKETTSSLRVCRGCLATDARLYDMRQDRLMEAYSTLLSNAVQVTDDLPHYLCSYCAVLLLKCDAFRTKCIDTLCAFRNAQLDDNELTTEHINILSNFKQAKLHTIDITSTDAKSDINTDESDTPSDSDEVEDKINEEGHTAYSATDIEESSNQINKLLNKFIGDKGSLLKDFEVNLDGAVNDNNYKMKYLSEIVNHIQYSSNASCEFFDILNRDCNDVPKEQITRSTRKDNRTKHTKPNVKDQSDINKEIKTEIIQNTVDVTEITLFECKPDIKKENVTSIPDTLNTNKVEITLSLLPNKVEINDPIDFESNETLDPEKKVIRKRPKPDVPYGCKGLINSLERGRKKSNLKGEEIKNKSKEFEEMYKTTITYFSKEEQLKEIVDRKESNNYKQLQFKCNVCYKGFSIEKIYKNHMTLHSDISGKFVCDICQYHFTSAVQLKKHKWVHSQLYTCNVCGHSTKHSHLAIQHSKWHTGKKYACKECGKEFRNNSSQYAHIKLCHPTSDQLMRCEICEDSFNGPTGLRFHDKKAHKEMTSPECLCSGCGTQFYCSDAFKAHQGTDGLCDTIHKYCVRCGMSFETEELLKEHEIEQRKPKSIYECDVCFKTFTYFAHFKMHYRNHLVGSYYNKNTQHKSNKRRQNVDGVICETCGKVLQNKGLLKMHIDVVHKKTKLNKYACDLCPKKYSFSISLQMHSRVHSGERPFQCELCPKAFQSKTNLTRHQLVHTGERPHTCEVCGKSFQAMSGVKLHNKTVHMKIPMPPRVRGRNKKTE